MLEGLVARAFLYSAHHIVAAPPPSAIAFVCRGAFLPPPAHRNDTVDRTQTPFVNLQRRSPPCSDDSHAVQLPDSGLTADCVRLIPCRNCSSTFCRHKCRLRKSSASQHANSVTVRL